jgi:hypothetical protein
MAQIGRLAPARGFKYPSTEEIESVTYNPDKVLPDCNPDNNVWKKK